MNYKISSKIKNMAILTIEGEDHTLGNLMQCQLLKDPIVKFAGYKKTHPLEDIIILKVQVSKLTPKHSINNAIEILLSQINTYLKKIEN